MVKKKPIVWTFHGNKLPLHQNDTLHTTASAATMAQEFLRVCANLLQQQTAGARFLLANAGYIRIVLPDFKLHLLLQRPARCGGRSPAPEKMQAPDSIGSRICQRRLCDDAYLHHRRLSADPVSQERQYTLFIYNSGGLLADEHCLLHQTETIRDSRRGNYRRRIRDASAYRRSDDRHLGIPLAGDADISRDAVPGLHEAQR